MTDQPLMTPLPLAEWDADLTPMTGPNGEPLNIFGTLAHHPKLLKRWLVFGNHVLAKSTLPARDRELLILRTGWRCRAPYEWAQHVLIGRAVGAHGRRDPAHRRRTRRAWLGSVRRVAPARGRRAPRRLVHDGGDVSRRSPSTTTSRGCSTSCSPSGSTTSCRWRSTRCASSATTTSRTSRFQIAEQLRRTFGASTERVHPCLRGLDRR